jgi:predicted acyltransferase
MSIAISFNKKQISNSKLLKSITYRSVLLILIGVFVNGFPYFEWQNLRIPGILQRIGLCYFLVASFWLFLLNRRVKLPLLWLSSMAVLLLLGYFVLLYYIPVPGMGINGTNAVNSWPAYLDQRVFGINHLWIFGTHDGIVTYDPEGILATLPACVNVLFGLMAGVIQKKHPNWYIPRNIFLIGLSLFVVGFTLDLFGVMPIIKKVCTSSFVLFSGGFSIMLLALITFLNNRFPSSKLVFYPFIVYGSNALIAFILSNMLMPIMDLSLFGETSIRQTGYNFFLNIGLASQWASFMYTSVFLGLLFLGLQILYRHKYFLKL